MLLFNNMLWFYSSFCGKNPLASNKYLQRKIQETPAFFAGQMPGPAPVAPGACG